VWFAKQYFAGTVLAVPSANYAKTKLSDRALKSTGTQKKI